MGTWHRYAATLPSIILRRVLNYDVLSNQTSRFATQVRYLLFTLRDEAAGPRQHLVESSELAGTFPVDLNIPISRVTVFFRQFAQPDSVEAKCSLPLQDFFAQLWPLLTTGNQVLPLGRLGSLLLYQGRRDPCRKCGLDARGRSINRAGGRWCLLS